MTELYNIANICMNTPIISAYICMIEQSTYK